MNLVVSTSAVLGRRTCAAGAVGSAFLHAVMLGHAGNPMVALLVAAMATACLFCAWELWRAGSPKVWCLVAVMNLVMVGLHMGGPGHQHGAVAAVGPAPATSPLMALATGVALGEALVAALVLCVLTWRRREQTATLVGIG